MFGDLSWLDSAVILAQAESPRVIIPAKGLSWIDYGVIIAYLCGMIGLGVYWSRQRRTDEEYFLAGRNMPWFAVGISVIASILSSLTYLSEPGEVWKSGITQCFGKLLAIPFEMIVVWVFCIPFMMSFRFTSAYEYLEHRYGRSARLLGVVLFLCMVVLWMGFVVLASSRALALVSGVPLWLVIGTIGAVSTMYTMLGGLRAVIWTDVIQVAILIGGGVAAILFVGYTTGAWLPTWYATAAEHLKGTGAKALPVFSFDPTIRATVITVALNMTIWHICTHLANQMTVQRYFSTSDQKTARRSFVTAALFGVGINLLLMVVGLAVLHYYVGYGTPLEPSLDPQRHDLIFPTFAVNQLPPGVGGAILAALLAAAMSSIDSGVNSIATVTTLELRRKDKKPDDNPDEELADDPSSEIPTKHPDISEVAPEKPVKKDHVMLAMSITLAAGLFITFAAYGLNFLPEKWGIVGSMPRTFNAITAPLGGFFFVGMFFPRVGERAAIGGVLCGLATSISLGYMEQIQDLLISAGLFTEPWDAISFNLIMPSALLATVVMSLLFSLISPEPTRDLTGYTWYSRKKSA